MPKVGNTTEALKRMPRARMEYIRAVRARLSNQSEDCLHMNIYVPAEGKLFRITFPFYSCVVCFV